MRTRVGVLGAGLAAVLIVAGAVGVAAQTGGSGSNPVGGFVERLAANLGIGTDELQAAMDKTHDEMIDDAVAQGRLTPERAEALKEREPGDGFGRFEFRFKGDGGRGAMPFEAEGLVARGPFGMVLGPVADAIGIDQATLLDGLVNGKSLSQIAQEHGVSREQLKQRLTEEFQGRLDGLLDQTFPFNGRAMDGRPWATPSASPSASRS